jgi:hypothetical protein
MRDQEGSKCIAQEACRIVILVVVLFVGLLSRMMMGTDMSHASKVAPASFRAQRFLNFE